LLKSDFQKAVVVVGAAHLKGLKECLKSENDFEEDYEVSKGSTVFKILRYGIPIYILSALGYAFYKIGLGAGFKAVIFWVLINGVLASLGAVIARSSYLTWIVSFISAPLTSLDPALGAGMVSAYFEGKINPPTMSELEELPKTRNYLSLWDNQAGRILLTFIFVSIGSAIATFLGAGYLTMLLNT
ncbi:MAG: hypothetical protein ABEI78_02475, partial [Candidatus Nanohaloarchaea archaeon]